MKAVCCDRCEKFEKAANFQPDAKRWLSFNSFPNVADPMGSSPEILLCPECAAEFKRFIKEKPCVATAG